MIEVLKTSTHSISVGGRKPTEEDSARAWRDKELVSTDWITPVTDHPQHALYLTYRQELRDWPSTPDFPNNRPVRP